MPPPAARAVSNIDCMVTVITTEGPGIIMKNEAPRAQARGALLVKEKCV